MSKQGLYFIILVCFCASCCVPMNEFSKDYNCFTGFCVWSDCKGIINPEREVCDYLDNDCDGRIDEDFDLQSDPNNCNECGKKCFFENANAECQNGKCIMNSCLNGWQNLNIVDEDGCEYRCVSTGAEICDGIDNNCDGSIDEGFDLQYDDKNCGKCGNVCRFSHAFSVCHEVNVMFQHVMKAGWILTENHLILKIKKLMMDVNTIVRFMY